MGKILELETQRNYLSAERRELVGFLMVLEVNLICDVLQEEIFLARRCELVFVRCQKQFSDYRGV
jgi:hypothetical protein